MNIDATIPTNEYIEYAKQKIEFGKKFPFDFFGDDWKDATPATDWAHLAARAVMADLTDRRGIRQEIDQVDDDVKLEILNVLTTIIREAKNQWDSEEAVG
jgi:hypothetical protein